MSAVGQVLERKERPAYVRFKRIAVEDKAESLKHGQWKGKDLDIAMITPPYSKDVIELKVTQWLSNMKQDVHNGRMPIAWAEDYEKDYERWKNGQEIPLRGTPIKGWGVISPAQQETLLKINILTVEDLAGVNDEGIRRIGMGSNDLKNKAVAWLAQLTDKGPLTVKMASLEAENAQLKVSTETLKSQVEQLSNQLKALSNAVQAPPIQVISSEISVTDIIETPAEQYQAKFGKPPDGRWSDSRIAEELNK